ncbi:glycoside hydrolase family 3 N-terminal domain-containing protein [Aciduricibacillus chroicocephali]|uniref:Glycoside hydrolase family 3 N-terminal domain-containing protein n=1 Tax=Aciduricibacillus chroicocephali TaxID=3054939 RepID=A0ABY9KX92_9BACI|nr:glycoside hydrolase family 3 N-terminal domain-containing protein [Bacillaceae bacterium 44XB]
MRKKLKWISISIFILLALVRIAAYFIDLQSNEPAQPNRNEKTEVTNSVPKEQPENRSIPEIVKSEGTSKVRAKAIVDAMSLEEKVGQLFFVGFQSAEPDEQIRDLIKKRHIGNVILFDRNMQTKQQVKGLNDKLQKMAMDDNGLPLLIGVDQEGGDITRMRGQIDPIPSQQKLGKGSDETVLKTARHTGKELSEMGFNTNFAPVLDLSASDSRSFGTGPENAYRKGAAVIKGFNENGITGAVKHFPGNGRSSIDPHEDTSSVEVDAKELEKTDAFPFKKMIEEENPDSFFVMVTHIKYPAYDKERPASLSPVIMKDVLRKKFGYEGIIVTDDFEMGAVSKYYPYGEIGVKALEAGADLIMICHVYEHQTEMYDGVIKAVKNGTLPESRIDEAATRVIEHKLKISKDQSK